DEPHAAGQRRVKCPLQLRRVFGTHGRCGADAAAEADRPDEDEGNAGGERSQAPPQLVEVLQQVVRYGAGENAADEQEHVRPAHLQARVRGSDGHEFLPWVEVAMRNTTLPFLRPVPT